MLVENEDKREKKPKNEKRTHIVDTKLSTTDPLDYFAQKIDGQTYRYIGI